MIASQEHDTTQTVVPTDIVPLLIHLTGEVYREPTKPGPAWTLKDVAVTWAV